MEITTSPFRDEKDMRKELIQLILSSRQYSTLFNLSLVSKSFYQEIALQKKSLNKEDLMENMFMKKEVYLWSTLEFVKRYDHLKGKGVVSVTTEKVLQKKVKHEKSIPLNFDHINEKMTFFLNSFWEASRCYVSRLLFMLNASNPGEVVNKNIIDDQSNHLIEVETISILREWLENLDFIFYCVTTTYDPKVESDESKFVSFSEAYKTKKLNIYKRYIVPFRGKMIYFSIFDFLYYFGQANIIPKEKYKKAGIDLEKERKELFLQEYTLKSYLDRR